MKTQPRICLRICDSVPVCVAVDRLRPCTSAELLAFNYTQTKGSSLLATDAQTQQGFIDERGPINPTVADSSRNANEGEDEDGKTTRCQSQHERRKQKSGKEIQMDDTAKELRAPLPTADPSVTR